MGDTNAPTLNRDLAIDGSNEAHSPVPDVVVTRACDSETDAEVVDVDGPAVAEPASSPCLPRTSEEPFPKSDSTAENSASVAAKTPSSHCPEMPNVTNAPPNTPFVIPSTSDGGGWDSWKSWGASIITSASNSVAKMSTELGQGISELVDPGMKEEARKEEARKEETEEWVERKQDAESSGPKGKGDSSFFGFFSSAGKGIVGGSINVLESVGKKTMSVIDDQDPGLTKTKTLLMDKEGRPTLSRLLRDAKAERLVREKMEAEFLEARMTKFDHWFEEMQGLVYLEALEILSEESEREIDSRSLSQETREHLRRIEDAFNRVDGEANGDVAVAEASSSDDFIATLTNDLRRLVVPITPFKVQAARSSALALVESFVASTAELSRPKEEHLDSKDKGLKEKSERDKKETEAEDAGKSSEESSADVLIDAFHRDATRAVGDSVARAVEMFHKTNQMTLMSTDSLEVDGRIEIFVDRVDALAEMKIALEENVRRLSGEFGEALERVKRFSSRDVDALFSDFHLESSRGVSFIGEAFKLSLPVMQRAYVDGIDDPQ